MMNQTSLPFLCELVREALEKQGKFVLRARGFSMTPFIEDGEEVEIVKAAPEAVRFGDVVCYAVRKPESEFPAMRIHRALFKSGGVLFVKGDTLLHAEKVHPSQLFGKVSAVRKKSGWKECKTPFAYLFGALPVLYFYARAYHLKTAVVPEALREKAPFKLLSSKMSVFLLSLPRAMMRRLMRPA